MRRLLLTLALFAVPMGAIAQGTAINRHDAFVLVWDSVYRPVTDVKETPYADVSESDSAFQKILFAKSRNILGDAEQFRPNDPLKLDEALVWLFRSRNIDDPAKISARTLSGYLAQYDIAKVPSGDGPMPSLTEDQLTFLMRSLDEMLISEVHEVSLYSEKFNGAGTAFGEIFDMNALTAAHKFYPYNTLVKVTNALNGKSVTVRINDRGPYVKGRDMDLSLGAFTAIAERREGVIHATFQRLGDVNIVGPCVAAPRYQQRITRSTILHPGIPHILRIGSSMTIRSTKWFVVRSVTYPDGATSSIEQWIKPNAVYTLKPAIRGTYTFRISSADGRNREMGMEVVDCKGEG